MGDIMIGTLCSGSKGNCTYITDGDTSILIDAGGCLKSIREKLNEVGDRLENIKGIFITHEHSDHTKALFNITKKYNCRIFTTVDTARAMCTPTASLSVEDCRRVARSVMTIKPEKTYEIGTFQIRPFSTPHDAADSIGLVAPRVMLCAAHQAHTVLRILAGEYEV